MQVGHHAVLQAHHRRGVVRCRAALHRRTRVDVVLHVAVAGADVDLAPRKVRVTEHDNIGVGKPAAQTRRPATAGPLSWTTPTAHPASVKLNRSGRVMLWSLFPSTA